MTKITDFEKAIADNGFTIIDGEKYAIDQEVFIDNYKDNCAYVSWGFTSSMDADEAVKIVWIDSSDHDEYQGDWESGAIIG